MVAIDSCIKNFDITPGIHQCVIPKDEITWSICGDADKNCWDYLFIVDAKDSKTCMTRGSIKIDGLEYGEFAINGIRATLKLKHRPNQDAFVEYEIGSCSSIRTRTEK